MSAPTMLPNDCPHATHHFSDSTTTDWPCPVCEDPQDKWQDTSDDFLLVSAPPPRGLPSASPAGPRTRRPSSQSFLRARDLRRHRESLVASPRKCAASGPVSADLASKGRHSQRRHTQDWLDQLPGSPHYGAAWESDGKGVDIVAPPNTKRGSVAGFSTSMESCSSTQS
jgi:hypothetical protein